MRIRQGNDFIFLWAIERNGEPEDFSNAVNIRLHFKNFDCIGEVKSFQIVDGNIVRVEVSPEWASNLGAYRLILSYEFENQSYSDGDQKCVVDVLAFNIVPKTSEADDITEMAKTTDIMIGLEGLSAYEVWLKDNPDKTKEDYYNWLRQPATDAAASLSTLEQTVSGNEALRVTAEQGRSDAELLRVGAEGIRDANEIDRINAEGIRDANETDRINAESDRVDAEDLRKQAEAAREEAEGLRQTNTATAIQNAEDATTAANTAAGLANNAATAANTAAGDANNAAEAANTAAGLADTARTELTTAVNTKLDEADNKIEEIDETLSTYDGRVTQVEADIDQLAGEVSLLDAVQGAKIKDIESIISTMNPNQSAQLSVSGASPLSLPKNAANGGMEVKLEGLTQDVDGVITNFEPTGRIRSVGKNLFDQYKAGVYQRGGGHSVSYTDEDGKLILNSVVPGGVVGYYIPAKENTTYNVKFFDYKYTSSSKAVSLYLAAYSQIPVIGDITLNRINENSVNINTGGQITTGANTKYLLVAFRVYADSAIGDYIGDIYVGTSSIPTTYEPYRETSLYLTAPELRSVGTVKDEIRKGANGYELVKRIGVNNIDGDTNFSYFGEVNEQFVTVALPVHKGDRRKKYGRVGLINFKTLTSVEYVSKEVEGIYSGSSSTLADVLIDKSRLSESTLNGIKDYFTANPSVFSYELAEPEIIPISYGGVLNSAENGTVYHEPIVADAGVYDTKMDILLTDYPIATIEEIIKHENGVDTYLNVTSAVIASDGLSFTHPDLADGDLVLFTYAFDKESTNGNITATFYDSNVVKIDTVTGKAYKIEDVVTNGVLTRILTEV